MTSNLGLKSGANGGQNPRPVTSNLSTGMKLGQNKQREHSTNVTKRRSNNPILTHANTAAAPSQLYYQKEVVPTDQITDFRNQ